MDIADREIYVAKTLAQVGSDEVQTSANEATKTTDSIQRGVKCLCRLLASVGTDVHQSMISLQGRLD